MSWADDMDRAIKEAGASAIKERNALVREACDEIVQRTPVDTGALKGSWHFTDGTPSTDDTPRIDADGYAPMVEVDTLLPQVGGDAKMFLTNNLDYALKIERGHEDWQAPEGMARVTIERFADRGR